MIAECPTFDVLVIGGGASGCGLLRQVDEDHRLFDRNLGYNFMYYVHFR